MLIKKDLKIQQIKRYMTAKIIDIKDYSVKSSDIFFFDNNIWMFLFCPLASYQEKKQKYYSSFLQEINTSQSTIFICSLVLSEFANRYLRMDYEQWKEENQKYDIDFKQFIGTPRYKETVIEVQASINKIMKFCEKSSDNFNAIDINNVTKHLTEIDFNDSYYIELAKKGNWKIVTDDRDFVRYTDHDVEIVTLTN